MTTTLVRRAGALALIAATTAGLTGCASVLGARMTYDDTEKTKITEIVLSGGRGDVTVKAVPATTETTVKRIIQRSDNPGESYRLDGTKMLLDTDCGPRCSADFEVTVPTGVTVSGTLQSGDVRLTGIGGTDFQLTSGDVTIDDATGPVVLRATSGDLKVGNAKSTVKVQSTSGDIRVLDAAGPVEARVTSGDLTVLTTKPGSVTAHATSGDVTVTVPTGDYKILTSVGSGEASLHGMVSQPSSANVLDVKTSSGDVNVATA